MIVALDELPQVRYRHKDKKIVLAGGGFDLFHSGHLDYLEFCRRQGDLLVIGIANDEDLRKRKGEGRPIIAEAERARLLDALGIVDYVFVREHSDLVQAKIQEAKALRPEIMVFYEDVPDMALERIKEAVAGKTRIVINGQHKTDSTTSIIKRIKRVERV